ncbi:hypothetical protein [Streptomyces enissocaesilis]|uniref:hypothetical protein n=1 Tax=Streptomyces enissocaesilis TaxID=332589 RepID=UPI0031D4EF88
MSHRHALVVLCRRGSAQHLGQAKTPRSTRSAREDLADLVTADTPLGPEQTTAPLGVRRVEFDGTVRIGWIRPPQPGEARFGASRAGAADVALYTTTSVGAMVAAHPEVD